MKKDGRKKIIEKLRKKPMSINDLDSCMNMHTMSIRRIIREMQKDGQLTIVAKQPSKKYRGQKINVYGIKR